PVDSPSVPKPGSDTSKPAGKPTTPAHKPTSTVTAPSGTPLQGNKDSATSTDLSGHFDVSDSSNTGNKNDQDGLGGKDFDTKNPQEHKGDSGGQGDVNNDPKIQTVLQSGKTLPLATTGSAATSLAGWAIVVSLIGGLAMVTRRQYRQR
ncbi:MAG: hypothetical protein Q4P66_06400, partial [Actinomycetaceae bacterium]|nr:hypothetical protein [Actinomycetaceae bacterium]